MNVLSKILDRSVYEKILADTIYNCVDIYPFLTQKHKMD